MLKSRIHLYPHAELVTASIRSEGALRIARGRLTFFADQPPFRDVLLDYGNLVLERYKLTGGEALAAIEGSLQADTRVGSTPVTLTRAAFDLAPWAWYEFRGLPNPVGAPRLVKWPSRSFLLSRYDHTNVPLPQGPFANTRLPLITDVSAAVDEFLEVPLGRYPAGGGIAVFLPDYRARLTRLVVAEESLAALFEVGKIRISDVSVRAAVDDREAELLLEKDATSGRASFRLSPNWSSIEIFLFDNSEDQLVDWAQLSLNAVEFPAEVQFVFPGAQLQRLVRSGEGQSQEFKRELGDGMRFTQSVVAFANGVGGTIFIGIDDEGSPRAVDQKATAETAERLIRTHCDPYVQVTFEPATIEGTPILLVRVPSGPLKPYVHRKRGAVMIRGGRTNFAATSEEIRRLRGDDPPR